MAISERFQNYIDLKIDGDIFETSVGRQKILWQGQPVKIPVTTKITWIIAAVSLLIILPSFLSGDQNLFIGVLSLTATFATALFLIISPKPSWRLALPKSIVYVLTDKQGYMFYSFGPYKGYNCYPRTEMKRCKRVNHKDGTASLSGKRTSQYKSREETSYGTTRTVTRTTSRYHGFYNLSQCDADQVQKLLGM